ncbi:MAG: PAS domain S-box protein, partial [Bacteroidota bacterium]
MKLDEYKKPAIKTAVYFFVFGFLWILLSDEVLQRISPSYQIESQLQTYKGWFFILITTFLIYFLVKQQIKRVIDLKNELSISERNLSVVLENIGEGIIYTDSAGIITKMNAVAQKLTGVKERDGIGRHLEKVLKIRDADNTRNLVGKLLTGQGAHADAQRSHVLKSADNTTEYQVYSRSDDIINHEGEIIGKVVAFKDMTNVLAQEKALRLSESRYRDIVEITHDLLWTVNLEGKIMFINDASIKIYGYTPQEMIGRKFADFIPEEVVNERNRLFYENLQKGITTFEKETEVKRRDGKTIYIKDNVSAVFDESGKLKAVSGASKDITNDILYRKELEASRDRLELALQGGGIGLWDYDVKKNSIVVNDQWKKILGVESEDYEIDSSFFESIIHPDDVQLVNSTFNYFIRHAQRMLDIEFRVKHSSGQWKWVLNKGKIADIDESGKPARIIGTMTDITEKKKLELELQHWVDIYRSFIKYSSEGIYLFELDNPIPIDIPPDKQVMNMYHQGYIRTCNDSFAKMYGYSQAQEMEGMRLVQFHGSDDNPENIRFLRKFVVSGYRVRQEISQEIDRNGNEIYMSNNVVGIKENNMLVRIWGSQINITEQVMAQKKLEESERRYRLLFETNPVPLVVFDMNEFNFYNANLAAEKLLGYARDEMLKLKIWDIRPEISLFTRRELKGELMREISQTTELRLRSKSGRIIQAEVTLDQIGYEGRDALLAAINDLTALKEAEKRVIQSLIEGENNERRRIAKELHDSLGQNLT